MATRSPINRLKSADLPTFGRPTIATIGFGTVVYLDFGQEAAGRGPISNADRQFATYQKDRPPVGRQRRKYTRTICPGSG